MDLLDSDTETKQDTDHDKRVKERSESLNQTTLQRYEHPKTSLEQNHIHRLAVPPEGNGGLQAKTETLCPSRPKDEGEREESEREETESSDDNTTQYSIHPPHDCPYLLLLQGCSPAQVCNSNTHSTTDHLPKPSLKPSLTNHSLATTTRHKRCARGRSKKNSLYNYRMWRLVHIFSHSKAKRITVKGIY